VRPPLADSLAFKRPPRTVFAYVAGVVILMVTLAPRDTHPGALTAAAILLIASAGLAAGIWFAWLFLVVIEVGNLLVILAEGQPWWWSWVALVKLVMLALLLSRPTRRHLRRPRLGRRFA
jgi:membrane protein implicated in regulation of membrane protease activity